MKVDGSSGPSSPPAMWFLEIQIVISFTLSVGCTINTSPSFESATRAAQISLQFYAAIVVHYRDIEPQTLAHVCSHVCQ